jgi:hypothetical protein
VQQTRNGYHLEGSVYDTAFHTGSEELEDLYQILVMSVHLQMYFLCVPTPMLPLVSSAVPSQRPNTPSYAC